MEKSYGIEAARAKLGDIADYARTTGQTVALTRHGRTVAVIGPAHTVTPHQGVEATLWWGSDGEWTGQLPGVPNRGNSVIRETEAGEERLAVTEVQWRLRDDGDAGLYVHLTSIVDE